MAIIYNKNALKVRGVLAPESIQACITSPPYFGLRDYGVTGQIGLESNINEYIRALVEVFRGVRKVLRPDGTLWLNLGDSYNGSGGAGGDYGPGGIKEGQPKYPGRRIGHLKPKDLIGIPWRVALALQADGWYLRSDIIWHKTNPMPESATDRPTRAHEYLFLLSKGSHYYYDSDAIAEPAVTTDARKNSFRRRSGKMVGVDIPGEARGSHRMNRNDTKPTGKRNRRTVWTIPTRPYPGAHFAVMPEALVEPCVLASTRPGDTVLDPFAGSGTTLAVAERFQREAVGFELNQNYIPLIEERLRRNQIRMVF